MTTDKDFKRLVRGRSDRTGESYSAARRRLLKRRGQRVPIPNLRRVEKPEYGFSIEVPEDWPEEPPDLNNSQYEVARFRYYDADARRLTLVSRPTDDAEPQVWTAANAVRGRRQRTGFMHFSLAECEWGGGDGVRIDCDKPSDRPRGVWTIREYLAVANGVVYILGMGTSQPIDDGPLFDEIATRFEVFAADR